MELTLHKLSEKFLITFGAGEFKNFCFKEGEIIGCTLIQKEPEYSETFYKVIAQQDQIDFSDLSEKEQKEIGYFDVEAEAERDWVYKEYGFEVGYNPKRCVDGAIQKPKFINGYKKGFQKAQELLSNRRFNEMLGLLEICKESAVIDTTVFIQRKAKEYLQSLSQPKSWKIEVEMEDSFRDNEETYIDDSGAKGNYSTNSKKPKLTNGKIKITKIC